MPEFRMNLEKFVDLRVIVIVGIIRAVEIEFIVPWINIVNFRKIKIWPS